nr:hypothetical protein [Tanacetum cinerariifolium]
MQEDDTEVAAASTPISAAKPKTLKCCSSCLNKEKKSSYPKPMKKKDQVEMDAEYTKKLQEELDKEHEEAYKQIDWDAALDHVQSKEPQYIKRYHRIKKKPQSESEARKNMISYLKNTEEEMEKEDEEIIKSINETPAQKATKRRKLSEEAQEADDLKKRLEIVQDKDDDVFVEAIPLAQKVHVVDYQVVVIDNKPKYKIIRADDTYQFYISFTTLLKNFDREDLETLWRIVKDRFSTSKPTNFSDEYLLLTLKTMFGELDEQDAIWRNQKSVHGLALVSTFKIHIRTISKCGKTSAETPTVKDKGKEILIKDPKPMKKKDQTREEMEKEDEEIIKSINETSTQKAAKRRKLSKEAQEADDLKKRLEIVQDEDDDVFVEAIPLAQKVHVVDYQVVVIDNKPKRRKGVVIRDPEEELHTDTPAETPTMKDKGKGILIEDPKPMKKKDQVKIDVEYAKKLQEELDKEHEEAYKQID